MLVESRMRVSAGSDLPFTKRWTPETGYTIESVEIEVTGATLGSDADGRAPATTGPDDDGLYATAFYLTSATASVAHVQYTVTYNPHAIVTREDVISFV